MKLDYKLKEVKPGIFYLKFKSLYEMAMLFLRYQEYYESTNPKFRGKAFTILEYMSWYVKHNNEETFNYPADYCGYNIPSEKIRECIQLIRDWNMYDDEMLEVIAKASGGDRTKKFYLIAGADDVTFNHELAHGLYYTDKAYKKDMDFLTKSLPKETLADLTTILKKTYTSSVIKDEIQAYMSTGLNSNLIGIPNIQHYKKNYIKIYNLYTGSTTSKKKPSAH